MGSTDILSQALSSITVSKLDQLQQQKTEYETKKRQLLENVASEKNTAKRIKKLLEGSEELHAVGLKRDVFFSNLKKFLDQAEYDPSVSEPLLASYEAELRCHLQAQTNKYEFASLYGDLVTEWIASGTSDVATTPQGSGSVVVGREEMHQQRATWEEYAFKAKETDPKAIRAYLDDVFSSKEAQMALETIRGTLKAYQRDWKLHRHFDESTLTTCINGMLRSDILTEEKRTTLRTFLENKVVLGEIADVLNMRMSNMASWSWGSPLIVEQRRNLNGRYRFYTDEDLLHSIFICYIGLRWATKLREVLEKFVMTGGVWKDDSKPISKADARRRRYFLQERGRRWLDSSVQKRRYDHFASIFLDQLPVSFDERRDTYGGQGGEEGDTKRSHVQVDQELLHRLQAEIIMRTRLGKEMTVIRSDFKWFGPSLSHSSIFAVLDFFGLDAEWMSFFKRVLEASMRFKQDSPDTPARIRKRGTPMSTPLASFFGESILFCVDYAVNQKADGTRLYRLHDDMWLWGSSETCASAWKVVTEFTNIMGLEINQHKTGCAQITKEGNSSTTAAAKKKTQPSSVLPKGDVTWGFLKLDPSTGRFLMNRAEVDKHIKELRLQLSACRSVLDYIQAWNIYGNGYFATNFGQPANCLGRAHIDSMLETFRHIQQALFPGQPGSVGGHLKRTIAARFGPRPGGAGAGAGGSDSGNTDIPDGYLYWPASMGGLGLQDPFIAPLMSRHVTDPDEIMDKYLRREELAYERAKAAFEEGSAATATANAADHDEDDDDAAAAADDDDYDEGNDDSDDGSSDGGGGADWRDAPQYDDLRREGRFMSFEEFTRYREWTSKALGVAYRALMDTPGTASVSASAGVMAALPEKGGKDMWKELSDYAKWVVQLHHKDMTARFGGLEVVDKGLLPTGLMTMLRESRFRWQV
ncbi:Reverse transcriptase domain-containing protein [Madurella fahalii]|uniref:Reverse transcriptase domain-containing protein n=1 Tax=Madurella fahalii TaxID=1157608 RepID=A0ABQ0G9K9_9PEZI